MSCFSHIININEIPKIYFVFTHSNTIPIHGLGDLLRSFTFTLLFIYKDWQNWWWHYFPAERSMWKVDTPSSITHGVPFLFGKGTLHPRVLMLFLWVHRPSNLIKTSLPSKHTHSTYNFWVFMEPLKPVLGSQLKNLFSCDHFNSGAEFGKLQTEPNPACCLFCI